MQRLLQMLLQREMLQCAPPGRVAKRRAIEAAFPCMHGPAHRWGASSHADASTPCNGATSHATHFCFRTGMPHTLPARPACSPPLAVAAVLDLSACSPARSLGPFYSNGVLQAVAVQADAVQRLCMDEADSAHTAKSNGVADEDAMFMAATAVAATAADVNDVVARDHAIGERINTLRGYTA